MKSCSQVQSSLASYLAMELSASEERAVHGHLQRCPHCLAVAQQREPALVLAAALARPGRTAEDDTFVEGVLAAVHQRRLEARIRGRRRRWWAAAAAAVVLLLVGLATLRQGPLDQPAPDQWSAEGVVPAVVEVEGEDVRLYQVSGAAGEVQVAFIIDPRLEL